jgi:hypothetical protein
VSAFRLGTLAQRTRCLIAIALVATGARSQAALAQSNVSGQRIIYESSTFKQGAPENARSVAQTIDGYLWLGTASGLFRFDGVRFELLRSQLGDRLLSTDVTAVFAQARGGLWIGYLFGGFGFVKNGHVSNFPMVTGTVIGLAETAPGSSGWRRTVAHPASLEPGSLGSENRQMASDFACRKS